MPSLVTIAAGPYRLSIQQYEGMTRAGILGEHDRVVLIDGLLVRKMPKGEAHVATTKLVAEALRAALPAGWHVGKEDPIALPGGPGQADSLPEPHLVVLRGAIRDYLKRKPQPEDVGLIVEVADTSLRKDRGMLARYDRSRVPTTWLIDLNARVVEVHDGPTGPAKRPRYRRIERHAQGATVPVVLDGVEVGRVAVRELLP